MNYAQAIKDRNYKSVFVIRMLGQYFCSRLPDSGLSVPTENVGIVSGLSINPTQVNLRDATTTINSFSFSMLDKDQVMTKLVKDRAQIFFNVDVEIWLGRSTGTFDFADYVKLPVTKAKKVSHVKNSYKFITQEATQELMRSFFNLTENLNIAVNDTATTLTATQDISEFPSSGTLRVDEEFITYAAKNDGTKQFTSCTRGALSSIAANHEGGTQFFNVVSITDNPLNILLKLMISGGGGGSYDTLFDGAGIDHTLIDIDSIESLRDSNFFGEQFNFNLYSIDSAMDFIENEILLACNLRFCISDSAKISVTLIDQSVFGDYVETIDDDSICAEPNWEVSENDIINVVHITWDYDEVKQVYRRISTYKDADSIATFGERPPLDFAFKGIKNSLSGQSIVDQRGARFLARFSTPTPRVKLKTFISKSLINIGNKVLVLSSEIPSVYGTLNFASELEVLSRAIDHENGTVNTEVAFTSYTGIRGAYIAPSDIFTAVGSQSVVSIASARGLQYNKKWMMRLWNDGTKSYESDPPNEILSILGDVITFKDPWATTLIAGTHRMRFADYDECNDDQHRYAFISNGSNDFADGSSTYKITF